MVPVLVHLRATRMQQRSAPLVARGACDEVSKDGRRVAVMCNTPS